MASQHDGKKFEVTSWQDHDGIWHNNDLPDWESAFLTTVKFDSDNWKSSDYKVLAGPWEDFDDWQDYVEDFIDIHDDDYFG